MMIPELPSGTLVKDQYLIQKKLGQGGFGRTYLACDNDAFRKFCVIKEFLPSLNSTHFVQKAKELFERESRVLCELNHSQIPRFMRWFEDNGRLFLVEEYVEGQTYSELLTERKQQGQAFSEKEITQWLRDLLPVLEYIHTRPQPIIHRDISPDNIMLPNDQSQPKLIDFGGVKQVITQFQQVNSASGAGYSSQPTVVTKEGYSAPELRHGECYPSSDLYSLAVTAIVLLTGKSPKDIFDSYSLAWKWRAYTHVGDRLASILDKMLAEKPQDRYQSVNEVLKDLNNTELSLPLMPPPHQSPPSPPSFSQPPLFLPQPKPKPWKLMALGSVGVLLLGGLVIGISPTIKPLCQVLNNCRSNPQDQEWAKRYDLAVKQANSARVLAQNPQSIEELQSVRDRFNNAITQLNQIPPDAEVYPEAKKLLPDYQAQLTEIEGQIAQEEQAQKQLEEAEAIARQAAKLTDNAQNVPQLEEARTRWQEATDRLNEIPSDALVSNPAREQISQNNAKVETINNQIDKLIADEQGRREAEARRAEKQRPRSVEPPVVESPPATDDSGRTSQPVPQPSPSGQKLPSCDVVLYGPCES